MKKQIATLLLLLVTTIGATAVELTWSSVLKNGSYGLAQQNPEYVIEDAIPPLGVWVLDVTVPEPGMLAEVLGDNVYKVRELTVKGALSVSDLILLGDATKTGKLEELDLSNAQFVILPDEVFQDSGNKSSLTKIILPEGLLSVGDRAFSGCVKLKEVSLPSTLVYIGQSAFCGCNIKNIDLPEALEFIGTSAFERSELEEVTIPGNCKWYRVSDPQFMQDQCYAIFSLCLSLKRVIINEGIEIIPAYMFASCLKLTEVILPSTLKCIDQNAFDQTPILNIELPEGLEIIENYAFNGCSAMTDITIPATVNYLGVKAFYGMTGLKWMAYKGSLSPDFGSEYINGEPYGPFGMEYYRCNRIFEENEVDGLSFNLPVYVPTDFQNITADGQFGCFMYFHNVILTDEFPSSGVENVTVAPACGDGAVYDLQGRRVAEPRAGQIYISNGRKFVMR